MRTLSKRQRKGLRTARNCVVCHKRYPPGENRSALHVYPDGCTAHDECFMNEDGFGTAHWHTVEAKQEDDYRQHVAKGTQ